MTIPAILTSFQNNGLPTRYELRTGRVVSPVAVGDPGYDAYVKRCLKQWSVDVELDNEEFLIGCRVLSMQGNEREGVRRLPRLPRKGSDGTVLPGDIVLVGFLNGHADSAVVLGTLSPSDHAGLSPEDLETVQVATTDPNETQDRLEHIDLSNPSKPLITSTMVRNTGLLREQEHAGETWVDDQARSAHLLERSFGGRSIETEHRVEVDAKTTAVLRTSDRDAKDLRSVHAVEADKKTSSVIIEDLQAKVLSLTQQVEQLNTLIMRSVEGKKLLLQQETPDLRTTVVSDSDTKLVSLIAEDLDEKTRAGWTIGPKGELILRRSGEDNKETVIKLTKDGDILMQTSGGASVMIDDERMLLSTGTATVSMSEATGINLTTKGGTAVAMSDDAVTVTGPACTIATGTVHLSTGALLVGENLAGASRIPSAEALMLRMKQIEVALTSLSTWAQFHTHPVAGTAAIRSVLPMPATAAPKNLFNLLTDTLKSVRGV